MHPLVWISLIGSGIALAIISSIEAKNYYERHKDEWEYERYVSNLRRNYRRDFGLPSDSEEEGDEDDEDNRPLASIRDQQGFRQRKNRQSNSSLSNDEQYYQDAEIELSRMEEKIVERKKRLEMEHSLLEKAEMDLERRRHEISTETNNLLRTKLSELSQNQPSSSLSSSSIHSDSDSFHPSLFSSAHQIPPPLPPLPASLSSSLSSSYHHQNVNNTSIHSEQRNINNNNNNTIISDQNDNHSTISPFVSVASFSSNQTALKQPPMDNSTLSLPQEPWSFEEDEDNYINNENNENNAVNNDMKFPNTINQMDDHHSEISWNTLSSQQQSTSILNGNVNDDDDDLSNFSLRTPAAPSEDGASSYDMLNGSDVDSHH